MIYKSVHQYNEPTEQIQSCKGYVFRSDFRLKKGVESTKRKSGNAKELNLFHSKSSQGIHR
jgi:hypothetical protein